MPRKVADLPDVEILSPDEFDFEKFTSLPAAKRRPGNPGRQNGPVYKDLITTFDIETTRIREIEQSAMFIWQWAFGPETVVVGRTWDEFKAFQERLQDALGKQRLVVYVHNLSYEFSFLRGVFDFKPSDVFCMDRRKILKCKIGKLEFRCSYLHANMNLDAFMKKMGLPVGKIQDFDYNVQRYPWTELNDHDLAYCVQDVAGLVRALSIEMEHDRDSLYTIPLTSTGYVRRDAKRAMRSIHPSYVKDQLPDFQLYQLLHDAFRGGNCHASRFYSGMILRGVKSADRSSAYPDNQCNDLYPVGRFFHSGEISNKELLDLLNRRRKAVVMRVQIWGDVRLRDPEWPCPYLSISKCQKLINYKADNGRVLSCDFLETAINDIDLLIILDEYRFDHILVIDSYHAKYGPLPPPLIKTTESYYRAKTELKGVTGQELYYTKAKNKLNSIYGMMAQDPGKLDVTYTGVDLLFDSLQTPEEAFTKNAERSFLPYQWGVYVTSLSRFRLEQGIRLAHNAKGVHGGFVYCDTDSVKYIGEVDWTEFNKERIAASKASGAYATDPKGVTHYMGVFEDEGEYDRFVTWGAKKYAFEKTERNKKTGELELNTYVTVSGVNKNPDRLDRPDGGRELARRGGLDVFKPGFKFIEAGGTESVYNDFPEISEYEIDGHKIPITANVVIKESEYTLGIGNDYASLLCESQPGILDRRNLI